MHTAEEVKARASNLRESFSGLGHSIKHGQCLDVISKLEGYSDWNAHSADISTHMNTAEKFVDDMLEGELENSYAKFTQHFESKYLIDFSEREYLRDMREIREDYGDYVGREFLGCVRSDTHPEFVAKYPNHRRYIWRGLFSKNEVLMVAGIYCKEGTSYVAGFFYR